MIKESEFFHGSVFSGILRTHKQPISIQKLTDQSNSSYILNETTGIFIKYSTKRLTPWRFSFSLGHLSEIKEIANSVINVYILLVCNDDGVVVLAYDELKQLIKEVTAFGWVSVKRERREMYFVKGQDGQLEYKIGRNEFPEKIFRRYQTIRNHKKTVEFLPNIAYQETSVDRESI